MGRYGASLFLVGMAWAQAPGLEPVPIALPKPLFEGTPPNLKVPNLEKPTGKPAGCQRGQWLPHGPPLVRHWVWCRNRPISRTPPDTGF